MVRDRGWTPVDGMSALASASELGSRRRGIGVSGCRGQRAPIPDWERYFASTVAAPDGMSVVPGTRAVIFDPAQVVAAADALATEGTVVAHAFANFYAITARGDAETVRRVNVMKGRPPGQVGSIPAPPASLPEVWDLDRLPEPLSRRTALAL